MSEGSVTEKKHFELASRLLSDFHLSSLESSHFVASVNVSDMVCGDFLF